MADLGYLGKLRRRRRRRRGRREKKKKKRQKGAKKKKSSAGTELRVWAVWTAVIPHAGLIVTEISGAGKSCPLSLFGPKEKKVKMSEFPEIQGGGSLIVAWQVKNKHVLVVGGGEVSFY
jgi:hypothetical protein